MFFISLNSFGRIWVLSKTLLLVACGQVIWPETAEMKAVSRPSPSPSASPKETDDLGSLRFYTVKPGDTLYSIGFRSGHGYRAIAAWNGIEPPYKIMVGQSLKLFDPAPSKPAIIQIPQAPGNVAQAPVDERILSQKKSIYSNDKKKLLKLYWQWPITGKVLKTFSQKGNKGIDISGRLGAPVKAAEAGKVVYSGTGLIGYGNLLIVKHNEMYMSAYANNSLALVEEGQSVEKGQIIAEVGKTVSGQPVLHFEIRKNGNPVNPLDYLPKD